MKHNLAHYRKTARKLVPFIAPYRLSFLMSVAMVCVTTLALAISPSVEGMATSLLVSDAADLLNHVPGAGIRFDQLLQLLTLLFLLYLTKTISQGVMAFTLTGSIQNSMHDLRNAVEQKLTRLPVQYFDARPFGDVLSRVTNDLDTVSNALQQTIMQILSGILSILLAFFMMLRINAPMTALVFLIIPAAILITRFIVRRSQQLFIRQQNTLGRLNASITEMYSGYKEILLFNKQEDAVRSFESVNGDLCRSAFRAQFMSSLISPLVSLSTYLIIGGIGIIGCLLAISGSIQVGQIQAFIRYVWQVNDPMSQVSNFSAQIQSAFAALTRIMEILEQEEMEEPARPAALPDPAGHFSDSITFEHVRFGYEPGKTVIHDLNLTVRRGQTIAIVGPTGAGKSTIINLLMRFYDPDGGRILMDGVDIRQLRREDLRRNMGMVLQDTWLFNGSIFDNLRYGRPDARRDEVISAARLANVHHFIKTLPGGYDMVINEEGGNISQGEKQLLTIARAILKNPDILILDEATSSVDTRLEKQLQEAMTYVMENRTSFVIAHRLSTIRNADRILVLDHGDVVEQGRHEELLEKGGFYARLYNSQFQSSAGTAV